MGKARKNGLTNTTKSVLQQYCYYMDRIRSDEPEFAADLPPDKEVHTTLQLESFLVAVGATGVLNRDKDSKAEYKEFRDVLQFQVNLNKETGNWPPAGFTLPAEKQQEQEEEREDMVLNEEEQPTKEDEMPEPENQDNENGEESVEEMTTTNVSDALAAESKQEPLQPTEPEPKPIEPQAPEAATVVESPVPVPSVQLEPPVVQFPVKLKENGKDKEDRNWQGNCIYGYFRVWHPELSWGEINSLNQRTNRWDVYKVKLDDIHQSVLKVMQKRIEVWDKKSRDPDHIYLSTYEYFETRLFVKFIPDRKEYIAKEVVIHEPSLHTEFATKNSLKLAESKFRDDLDARIASVKKEIGETIVSTMRDEVKKAKNTLENSLNDLFTSNFTHASESLAFKSSVEDLGKIVSSMQSQFEKKNLGLPKVKKALMIFLSTRKKDLIFYGCLFAALLLWCIFITFK